MFVMWAIFAEVAGNERQVATFPFKMKLEAENEVARINSTRPPHVAEAYLVRVKVAK